MGLCQISDELGSGDVFLSVSLQVRLAGHTCSLVYCTPTPIWAEVKTTIFRKGIEGLKSSGARSECSLGKESHPHMSGLKGRTPSRLIKR